MDLLLDVLFARINLIIVILLCVIYVLRKIQKNKSVGFINALNRSLRRYHKTMGILAIIFGIVHGFLSSDEVFTFNLGTLSWVLLILLGASWYFKSKLTARNWMHNHQILAVLFLVALTFHIVDVGGFTSEMLSLPLVRKPYQDSDNTNYPGTKNIETVKYKDGLYTGMATGYRPGLTVQVTISNGKITDITIIAHNERDPRHYSLAMKQIPEEIINKQSTSVDGVSGATRTSNGIKNAVNDALKKAVVP